jgi:hypothetical protein
MLQTQEDHFLVEEMVGALVLDSLIPVPLSVAMMVEQEMLEMQAQQGTSLLH